MVRSLRTKFLLIVLGGAVLPLAVVGVWLTRSAERSGGGERARRTSAARDGDGQCQQQGREAAPRE